MKIGIAGDHGGFALKEELKRWLTSLGHELKDFGAYAKDDGDDFPDFVVPLARAVASAEVERGIALCGSGVGASVAANKVAGGRAALTYDKFFSEPGGEDGHMELIFPWGRGDWPTIIKKPMSRVLI